MSMTQEKAIEELTKQFQIIPTLISGHHKTPEFNKWHRDTCVALEHIPGKGIKYRKEFGDILFSDFCAVVPPNRIINHAKYYRKGLEKAQVLLQSIIDEIQEYGIESQPKEEISYEKDQKRLSQRHHVLEKLWDTASKKLGDLEKDRILETRSEERLRLKQHIEEVKNDLKSIEQEMKEIESQLQSVTENTELCQEEKDILVAAFKCDGYQFDLMTDHQNFKEPLIMLKIKDYESNINDVKRYYKAFQLLHEKMYIRQIAKEKSSEIYELTSTGVAIAQTL